MATTLTTAEEAQLAQTIEMFEVITQSQPHDYQSLEILKEAYNKLGREQEVISASKRIASAYVQMGQISSAILEYETILQRAPEDADVLAALSQIESQAASFPENGSTTEPPAIARNGDTAQLVRPPAAGRVIPTNVEDGRRSMQKIFVDGKVVTQADFDQYWPKTDLSQPPNGVIEPFIQVAADKGLVPMERALKILCDKSRFAYLPMQFYDIDMDLARGFPAETCQRWCVLPFDKMSKSVLVATANPFNQQAAKELAEATNSRLLWYLVPPVELVKNLRKAFR
jgi:tetratricopeptide (TPR) repeat protein